MPVEQWVKDLTEELWGGPPFAVGDRVTHPDGRTVQIMDGQFWGEHGVSNFWYYREVKPDDGLSRKLEHGYGWRPNEIP